VLKSLRNQRFWAGFYEIGDVLADERARWVHAGAIFSGLGVAAYFGQGTRPGDLFIALGLILFGCLGWWFRENVWGLFLSLMGAAFFFGGVLSSFQLHLAEAPVLEKTLYMAEVRGTVEAVDIQPSRTRLTIRPLKIEGLDPENLPRLVRISVAGEAGFDVGEPIDLTARLFPLRPPLAPDSPNFSRRLYLDGIGATGFAYTVLPKLRKNQYSKKDHSSYFSSWKQLVENTRLHLVQQVNRILPSEEAGLTNALMVGDRGGVPDYLAEALRRSGLAHLLAISGLHMGLLCGTVFFLIRFGFAALSNVALRYPVKKIAAGAAFLAGAMYLLLSGATVPTQRAFVMTGVVLLAVLVDRRAISLRLVALAAFIVMAVQPDAVLGPSFQLSFAAVTILVAFYEGAGRKWISPRQEQGPIQGAGRYLWALLVTSILVTLTTAPIILFHFGRISVLGIIANLVAIPLMAFWIMPCIVLALALFPIGLAFVPLYALSPGLKALIALSKEISAHDWGLWYLARPDGAAVLCLAIAVLWLVIWQRRHLRLWGIVPLTLAGVFLLMAKTPDILVAGNRQDWVVFDKSDNRLVFPDGVGEFSKSLWMERFGINPERKDVATTTCTSDPCLVTLGTSRVAISKGFANPFFACRHADIVISLEGDVPQNACSRRATIIDDDVLWWNGGVALYGAKERKSIHYRTVADNSGKWPWIVIGGRQVTRNRD
jgi:competence protein ComEC